MPQPKAGDPAPDFTLKTADNRDFTLSEKRGAPVILFFYPQDDTPACTHENSDFSGLSPEFRKRGAIIAGISPNTVADHAKFRAKYGLRTLLLADPDHRAIGAYGVWGPKQMAGHHYTGLIRTTFLIGADGVIVDIFKVARTKGHAAKVLAALDAHSG